MTSEMVYLPALRSGSATTRTTMIHATTKPIEYISPSKPNKDTSPAMPRKAAADM